MSFTRIKYSFFCFFLLACKKEQTYIHQDLDCSCAADAEGTYVGDVVFTDYFYPSNDTTYSKTYIVSNVSTKLKCLVIIDTLSGEDMIEADGVTHYSSYDYTKIKDGVFESSRTGYTPSHSDIVSSTTYHGIKQ